MNKFVAATGVLVASSLPAAAATAAPGKLRAAASASGAFAVTSAGATVNRPHHIWVRLVGAAGSGTAVVSCSRGSSISANSYDYRRAGTYAIPIRPAGADSCRVVASVGGNGRVRVEIRAI